MQPAEWFTPTLSLPQQVDNGASGPLPTLPPLPPPIFLTNTYLEILFLTCSLLPPLWRDGDGQLAIRCGTTICEEDRPVQTKKIVFAVANVVITLLWLRFLVRLIEKWNLMKPDVRDAAGIFMVFFLLLWMTMIREKKEYLSLGMAFGILAAVYRVVRILL